MRPGGIFCGHDLYKTSGYTKSVLESVPVGEDLYLGGFETLKPLYRALNGWEFQVKGCSLRKEGHVRTRKKAVSP